jgi:hypothetical protein
VLPRERRAGAAIRLAASTDPVRGVDKDRRDARAARVVNPTGQFRCPSRKTHQVSKNASGISASGIGLTRLMLIN